MATAQTLITDAYTEAQIVDPVDGPDGNQSTLGLRFLNRIIGRLSTQEVIIPYSTSEAFSTTAGQASYTMGSGGTASSERAKIIKSAFIRDSDNYDYPLMIAAEKSYNAISDKTFQDRPGLLFYDPVYPVGVIYFFPVPDAVYTVFIESAKDLHSTLSLATTLSLPTEYEDALILFLAAKLARMHGTQVEQSLWADANSAWQSIARRNIAQRVPVATGLPFSGGYGSTSLFTDSTGFPYTFPFVMG